MRGSLEWGIRYARQNAAKIRSLLLVLKYSPKRGVRSGYEQQDGDDGAHRKWTIWGLH
jgi:hypothetical protein